MGYYKDKTANEATINANREWKKMARVALRMRQKRCSLKFEEEWLPKFTGIFQRLLTDPVEDLEKAIRNKGEINYEL